MNWPSPLPQVTEIMRLWLRKGVGGGGANELNSQQDAKLAKLHDWMCLLSWATQLLAEFAVIEGEIESGVAELRSTTHFTPPRIIMPAPPYRPPRLPMQHQLLRYPPDSVVLLTGSRQP